MAQKKKTLKKSKKSIAKGSQTSKTADSTFFLKAVVFLILGSQWLFIEKLPDFQIPLPIGLAIGLVFATHDHFIIDRKIEYVILLFAAFISYWLPLGIVISL